MLVSVYTLNMQKAQSQYSVCFQGFVALYRRNAYSWCQLSFSLISDVGYIHKIINNDSS